MISSYKNLIEIIRHMKNLRVRHMLTYEPTIAIHQHLKPDLTHLLNLDIIDQRNHQRTWHVHLDIIDHKNYLRAWHVHLSAANGISSIMLRSVASKKNDHKNYLRAWHVHLCADHRQPSVSQASYYPCMYCIKAIIHHKKHLCAWHVHLWADHR